MRYWWLPILLCGNAVFADVRAEIAKEYLRSTEATSLKYLDGVYSIRAPKFQLFNAENLDLDLRVERTRWEAVIQPAVQVKEKVDIKSLQQLSPDRVQCDVTYLTKLVVVNQLTGNEDEQILTTGCRDLWVLLKGRWRLLSTHVTQQEFNR